MMVYVIDTFGEGQKKRAILEVVGPSRLDQRGPVKEVTLPMKRESE